jgi:hypothetical protein
MGRVWSWAAVLGLAAATCLVVPRDATVPGARAAARVARLPVLFEANEGQTDPRVRFLAHAGGGTLFLTRTEAVLAGAPTRGGRAILRLRPLGANPGRLAGVGRLPTHVGYFSGRRALTDVPAYGAVRDAGLYPGIDLRWFGTPTGLDFDLDLAPGADPGRIALALGGTGRAAVDRSGSLVVRGPGGAFRLLRPRIYQRVGGRRLDVPGAYVLSHGVLRFRVGAYDRRQPLVIDPPFVYSAIFGGSSNDQARAIAVDASGDAYVAGFTTSADFPTRYPPPPRRPLKPHNTAGSDDAFVAELNPAGSAFVYAVYLGGSSSDQADGIAVDSRGWATVVGHTISTDFPHTTGVVQPASAGSIDAFVARLSPTGMGLGYSTYFGGAGEDDGNAVALGANGTAYVAGTTNSTNLVTTPNAYQRMPGGGRDAFVVALDGSGSRLLYSSYLGGNDNENGNGIAVSPTGRQVYVAGSTGSTNFPVTFGQARGWDAFVVKLGLGASSTLTYSARVGGGWDDYGLALAVDRAGAAFVTGYTDSGAAGTAPFPTSPSAFQGALNQSGPAQDAFVFKLDPSGGSLDYATYLGGEGADVGEGIAVDRVGAAYVTGWTNSLHYPVKLAPQPALASPQHTDAFATKLTVDGSKLIYSTYYGGTSEDAGFGIALDAGNNAFVAGETEKPGKGLPPSKLPHLGGYDAFVVKIRSK